MASGSGAAAAGVGPGRPTAPPSIGWCVVRERCKLPARPSLAWQSQVLSHHRGPRHRGISACRCSSPLPPALPSQSASRRRTLWRKPCPCARGAGAPLPVPTTVSPQMQRIIGAPISPTWKVSEDGGGMEGAGRRGCRRSPPAAAGDARAVARKDRAANHRRRQGLRADTRSVPPREPQPAAHPRPRRLLCQQPREVGHQRGHHDGGLRPLQSDVGRLSHAAGPSLSRRTRRRDGGVQGGAGDGAAEEHGDLRFLRRRRADARRWCCGRSRTACRCRARSRRARRCPTSRGRATRSTPTRWSTTC